MHGLVPTGAFFFPQFVLFALFRVVESIKSSVIAGMVFKVRFASVVAGESS
jgi:hypothetical protein